MTSAGMRSQQTDIGIVLLQKLPHSNYFVMLAICVELQFVDNTVVHNLTVAPSLLGTLTERFAIRGCRLSLLDLTDLQ